MKLFPFVALFVATTPALLAQPVKDIHDAQDAVRAHVRDMAPAFEQLREMARMLEAFSKVQRALSDPSQPGIAFDNARDALRDYLEGAERRNAMLDRDLRGRIDYSMREIEAARNGSAFSRVEDLREKLHHNVVHPLQRRAVQMVEQVNAILTNYDMITRQLRGGQAMITDNLEGLAFDPEKP